MPLAEPGTPPSSPPATPHKPCPKAPAKPARSQTLRHAVMNTPVKRQLFAVPPTWSAQ
jgi:hypothetical protein